MLKKLSIFLIVLVFIFLSTGSVFRPYRLNEKSYDVVVYGGSLSGFSAIKALKFVNPNLKVLLIVPQKEIGEIATVAAQNYWDIVPKRKNYIKGTFAQIFQRFYLGYNPDEMSAYLDKQINRLPNVKVMFLHDISDVTIEKGIITDITLQKVRKSSKGYEVFVPDVDPLVVKASIFIDASYTGRLLRFSNFMGITGRNDYAIDGKQQAATLMFEISNLNMDKLMKSGMFRKDADNITFWGAWNEKKLPLIAQYNKRYAHQFKIKGINMARGEKGKYWINGVLMYKVDATKEYKDIGTKYYPQNNYYSIDQAYVKAKKLVNSSEFKRALRSIPGFENVQIVRTADMLYVRESIHSSLVSRPTMKDFALNSDQVGDAGSSKYLGADKQHYKTRIGLGYYNMDVNGYDKDDPYKKIIHQNTSFPSHPVYVPYEVLLNPKIKNVLICGYGANISSIAWAAMRVLPNQMVLGDAAGIAASVCADNGAYPHTFDRQDISMMQSRLRKYGVQLEK